MGFERRERGLTLVHPNNIGHTLLIPNLFRNPFSPFATLFHPPNPFPSPFTLHPSLNPKIKKSYPSIPSQKKPTQRARVRKRGPPLSLATPPPLFPIVSSRAHTLTLCPPIALSPSKLTKTQRYHTHVSLLSHPPHYPPRCRSTEAGPSPRLDRRLRSLAVWAFGRCGEESVGTGVLQRPAPDMGE